jgi:uncharacterized protein
MTKIFLPVKLKLLIATLAIFLVGLTAHGQENQPWSVNTSPLPAPTGFVNDYAGVIDAATKQQLETKLKNLKETTNPSVEIAVAVVRTTGDRAIFDYSLAVGRGWKIGSKEDDNPSALLLVAIDDRKYFTQVSKDLEDELPDGIVGSLQRQHLVPEFRKGNYGKGISDTIDAYIATIQSKSTGTAAPQKRAPAREKSGGLSVAGIVCCGAIILVILLLIFGRSKGGRKDDDDDGWGGGAASALPWVVGSILAGSGSSSGSSSSWGGSSDGGGSDWGGFGGGGDFGGGGGGGDW